MSDHSALTGTVPSVSPHSSPAPGLAGRVPIPDAAPVILHASRRRLGITAEAGGEL